MTDDDDLRLNTLHRFAKHSPKLILHEYSHCEVPAGCGGVVVRWIDPETGRPAEVRAWVHRGTATAWLDGQELQASVTQLREGVRVIALHLVREGGPGPFALDVSYDGRPPADLVAADAEARWRCTATRPSDDGTTRDFDDRGWDEVPVADAALIAAQDEWGQRGCTYRRERGQTAFALLHLELWVRVAFTVTGGA